MTGTRTDVLDGVSASAAIKVAVLVATTANISLSGTQTIDGVSVVADDRVLAKDQTDTTENGIYSVQSGDWERVADFDGNRDVRKGTLVSVISGTLNQKTMWRCTSTEPITIDSSAITFDQFLGTINNATTAASGVVELATDAEAQGKADTSRALTPSNLAALGASTTFAGLVELATDAETQTGTDTARAITPSNLSARTATTSRTGIAELATDAEAIAKSDTGRVITPSNMAAYGSSDTFAGLIEIAVQSEMETGTDTTRAVVPGRQQYHPSAAKLWLKAGVTGNILTSYNITSLNDDGTGLVTVTIATDFSSVDYALQVSTERAATSLGEANARISNIRNATLAAGTFTLECYDGTGTTNVIKDPASWHCVGYGDHA